MKELENIAARFHTIFAGLERAHGQWQNGERQANNKVKGKARTLQTPVTDALWARHLNGEIGIGIVPVTDLGTCIWGAIDIDVYDGLDHEGIEHQLAAAEVPMVVLRSKSGGAHLYMFVTEPVKARLMQQRLKEVAMVLGHPTAEVFPKQISLDGDGGTGNWINMPYQDAVKTVRYAVHQGRALSPEEFLELAEVRKITPEMLQELQPKAVGQAEEWSEAPPCLQYLVGAGFPEGARNNALIDLGVYAKKRYPEEWQDKVAEYNALWMNGTYTEVNGVIRSLSRVDYKYKCSDVPICNHCNKVECYTRKYGITDGQEPRKPGRPHKNADGPCVLDEVDKPIKVYRPTEGSSDEPQWVLTLMGKRMDVSLDMFMDQNKFLREFARVFERLRLAVPLPRWHAAVNDLMSEAEALELPPDAGPEGQLMQHLEAFCNGKVHAEDKTELILGRPWTDEDNFTWFRSKDFMAYLDRQRFKEFKEKAMWAVFRRHGAKNDRFMIKKTCVAVWAIPAFDKQQEELDPVTIPWTEEQGDKF